MPAGRYHSNRPPVEGCPQPDAPWRDPAPVAPRAVGNITCETCVHYVPDPINPPAGMGSCSVSDERWHPMAPHRCKDFKPKDTP